MIRPLRTAHRKAFLFLGIGLPVLFVAAVVSRNPNPLGPAPPSKERTMVTPLGEQAIQIGNQKMFVRLTGLGAYDEPRQYVFSNSKQFAAPELLLYWYASDNPSLPANASLVGQFVTGREFSLPKEQTDKGFLFLYDAPHKKLLAAFPLGKR